MTRRTGLGRTPLLILTAALAILSPAAARSAGAQAGALDPTFGTGGLVPEVLQIRKLERTVRRLVNHLRECPSCGARHPAGLLK